MKNDIYEIIDPGLDVATIKRNEAIFHNANGYIGIRYDFEEGYPDEIGITRSQYINGFFDVTDVKRAENLYGLITEKQIMVNVANTQPIRLIFDGEPFSMFQGSLLKSRLRLDFSKGITVREVIWRSPQGKEARIVITRMASFHQLPLFTIEYEVEPLNFSGNVVFESVHDGNVVNYTDINDPRMAAECPRVIFPVSCELRDGVSFINSETPRSGLRMCSCVENVLSKESQMEFHVNDNQSICVLKTQVKTNEKIRLVKYSIFCDSIRYNDCREQTMIELQKARSIPLSELYKKQREYLKEYWMNCFLQIDGEDELDRALKFNMYHLLQSVSKDPYGNIAPKGLSGDGYEGHYFWDSEMFVQPFFTITNPEISKNMIEFRYRTLEKARQNARLLGHDKGALYPWRTISGDECSGYYPSGSAQYHINGDIVYSIIGYYLATKDTDFLLKKGAEIILETARLWIEAGNFYEGVFLINGVTGPDEYTCIVNNNYYTNLLAQFNLKWAVKIYMEYKDNEDFYELARKIGVVEEEIQRFQKAAQSIYLPYDEKLKINPQDDSFLQKKLWDIASIPKENFPLLMHYHPLHIYRHQICKQADTVMAHFILEDAQTLETIKNSFIFYEKITTHDSSLSKPIFSIVAAKLGMEQKALEYFGDSAKLDFLDLYNNTEDGIHVANMAGSYMTIIYGFAGFRMKEDGIYFKPILPEGWEGYQFKINFEGSRIYVVINNEECTFRLEKGGSKQIIIYDHPYSLDDSIVVKRSSCKQYER